jgi:hypothetical protein
MARKGAEMDWQKYFTDPAWLSVIVPVILAIGGLAAYRLRTLKKRFSYETISKTRLLTVQEEFEGKLKVLYDGEVCRDIQVVVLKLFNSGDVPIVCSDYDRPISIATGAASKILSAVITAVDPGDLDAQLTVDESRVEIHPIMLNSRDSITVKLLVSDLQDLTVGARIVGVDRVSIQGDRALRYMMGGLALVTLGFVCMMLFKSDPTVPTPPKPWQFRVGVGVVMVGYFLMVASIIKKTGPHRFLRLFTPVRKQAR